MAAMNRKGYAGGETLVDLDDHKRIGEASSVFSVGFCRWAKRFIDR